jgi:hypothetical protein
VLARDVSGLGLKMRQLKYDSLIDHAEDDVDAVDVNHELASQNGQVATFGGPLDFVEVSDKSLAPALRQRLLVGLRVVRVLH